MISLIIIFVCILAVQDIYIGTLLKRLKKLEILNLNYSNKLNNMDEFIENFQDFRTWLYNQQGTCLTPQHRESVDKIINKFEELKLHEAF